MFKLRHVVESHEWVDGTWKPIAEYSGLRELRDALAGTLRLARQAGGTTRKVFPMRYVIFCDGVYQVVRAVPQVEEVRSA